MTIATGARSRVGYIAETVYGTTPATPQLVQLPFQSWNVNLTRDEYEDNSIVSDRMQRYSITGDRHVAGDIDVNYSPLNFDVLLESVLWSSFATNVLKIGQTMKSFTMEEQALDIVQHRVFTGITVDKLQLTIPASGIVTAKFSVIGKDQSALAVTTIDTDSTYTASAAALPFTDNGVSGYFKIGGSAVAYVSSFAMTLDNNLSTNFTLGSATLHGLTPNFFTVTGSMNVLFEDAVAYNLFLNQTPSTIDIKLDNGTNTHQFYLPNVKITAATKTISGNGPQTMACTFKGLYDGTSVSNIVITRS